MGCVSVGFVDGVYCGSSVRADGLPTHPTCEICVGAWLSKTRRPPKKKTKKKIATSQIRIRILTGPKTRYIKQLKNREIVIAKIIQTGGIRRSISGVS